MRQWKDFQYSLLGPLMIWVAFIVVVPFLGAIAIVSLQLLPPLGDTIVKTVGIFCTLVLGSLGALAEIAPPFVTGREVSRRNRKSEERSEHDITWEDVPFLPPVLNRIRSTTGKRKIPEAKEEGAAMSKEKPSAV